MFKRFAFVILTIAAVPSVVAQTRSPPHPIPFAQKQADDTQDGGTRKSWFEQAITDILEGNPNASDHASTR